MGSPAGGRIRATAASSAPRRRRLALGAAVWTLLGGVALADRPEPRADHFAEPRGERRGRDEDPERAEALRRAREEIRKDPTQKKFILFRYGLREQDLR
ncbi:MAG: hypothetical protein HYY35_12245 [Deltaproteobacteria bacterium]|nr:hypothetical protein [Deltaproteobacteria bacterium]